MKKLAVAAGILSIGMLLVPRVRDELSWQSARFQGDSEALGAYVAAWPEGAHHEEARYVLDEERWIEARELDTVRALEEYLAVPRTDDLEKRANERIDELREDDSPFDQALAAFSGTALERFLRDFPGHRREAEASEILEELRRGEPISELLEQDAIAVTWTGIGIESMAVTIENLSEQGLSVALPAGSYLIADDQSVQNMVVTRSRLLLVPAGETVTATVAVACANRARKVPSTEDHFTLDRAHASALAQLAPILDEERTPYPTLQAAVWIITDNATWEQMGVLTQGIARVIRPENAVEALRSCDRAGIPIEEKWIWEQRLMLLGRLEAGPLSQWLEERGGGFLRGLRDSNFRIRMDAARGLSQRPGAESVAALLAALDDEAHDVRAAAAVSLGAIGDESCVPALIALLEDESVMVTSSAAGVLGRMLDPRAVEPLIELLSRPWYASTPAWHLGDFGDLRAVEPLCEVLRGEDVIAAQNAAVSLGKLGDRRAIQPLIDVVDRRMNSIPERASEALSLLTGAEDVPTDRNELIAFWKAWTEE